MKTKTKNKSSIGPLKVNGKITTDDTEMAKIKKKNSVVFYYEDSTNIPVLHTLPSESTLRNIEFRSEDVEEKILALKKNLLLDQTMSQQKCFKKTLNQFLRLHP